MKDPIKNTTKLPGEIRLIGYDSGVSSTTKKTSKSKKSYEKASWNTKGNYIL